MSGDYAPPAVMVRCSCAAGDPNSLSSRGGVAITKICSVRTAALIPSAPPFRAACVPTIQHPSIEHTAIPKRKDPIDSPQRDTVLSLTGSWPETASPVPDSSAVFDSAGNSTSGAVVTTSPRDGRFANHIKLVSYSPSSMRSRSRLRIRDTTGLGHRAAVSPSRSSMLVCSPMNSGNVDGRFLGDDLRGVGCTLS